MRPPSAARSETTTLREERLLIQSTQLLNIPNHLINSIHDRQIHHDISGK